MIEQKPGFISPPALARELTEIEEISTKIGRVSDCLSVILMEIDDQEAVSKIINIRHTLINQSEICDRLAEMYREVFWIHKRLVALLRQEDHKPEARVAFQQRTSAIINEHVLMLQRELFFKIVNAKEVADGEKSEDGPALLYPGIEKVKNEIIRHIQTQAQQLRPAAVDICKSFRGIADEYIETDMATSDAKGRYDTIFQSYELEKRIKAEISADITLTKIEDQSYIDTLIKTFETLTRSYRRKIKALNDKTPEKVLGFDQKVRILERGIERSEQRVRPLKVLKNLIERFPALERQLDLFAESYYQAKAVKKFLDEVNEEMDQVFQAYNLESFTVVSFLRYKLNGTSHMYECIHYYYALVQIEADIFSTLKRRHEKLEKDEAHFIVTDEMQQTGVTAQVRQVHDCIAKMNESNYAIHIAFLEYKAKPDVERLRSVLKQQTALINSLHLKIKSVYKRVQETFFDFLAADLGATEFAIQMGRYIKQNKNMEEGQVVRRGFETLLAGKKKEIKSLESLFLLKFRDKLSREKIAAMAALKVRQDFQREILRSIQKHPPVQDLFIHILKAFIKVKDAPDKRGQNDSRIVQLTQKQFTRPLAQFKKDELSLAKKLYAKDELTDRDLTVMFIAANITFQEIESFSRLLPGLPRNEFQLDSPYGRILLDIKTMFHRMLQYKSASGNFILEKGFERKERQKLISKIYEFMIVSLAPCFKKIDSEEQKINTLIDLERRKYRKDLTNAIRYWNYLIQNQIEPGQGMRGSFRRYSTDEKRLMMKYISPQQLETIDRRLMASYDLEPDPKRFEVEAFFMEIASGLFEKFNEDLRIRAEFEEYEQNKKIKSRKRLGSEDQDLLESETFLPNVKRCIKQVNQIKRQAVIQQYLDYWEHYIDQYVPVSDKRKKPKVPKVELQPKKIDAVEYISGHQLEQILIDLELIEKVRDESKRIQLIRLGLPLLKIGQSCLGFFNQEADATELGRIEKSRLREISVMTSNADFKRYIAQAVSLAANDKALVN